MNPKTPMTKSNSSESARTSDATAKTARLLDGIRSPADIKALREQDLPQLAQEVRDELIKVLSQTGGHLGPNLGVVELTIALHRVFDTPRDRFVMDVSHQGYVHKMFTGRLDRFHTMRQFEGLNGFLLRTESEHDCYGAGHAGTALSAGLGMAVGRDLRGGDENIVVIAGDAAFTCGISYEALNNVKTHTKRFIVVLNDNEWSIAKNVGAIANYLNSIVTNPTYAHLHDKARDFVQAILGKTGVQLAHKVEESVKGLLVPSVIFEELGLRYYGPIDGHDIPLLIRTFEFLKTQEEPVLLHILTKKGKGYEPAIKQPDKFHGLGKYKIESGETAPTPTPTYSEIIGKTLAKFAETNQKLVAITAAMPSGTGLSHFAKAHPDSLLRRRHCGRARRAFRLWVGDARPDAVSHDLFHVFSARLRHGDSRHGDPKTKRQALHGPRWIKRRRWPDASWFVRHRLSAPHPELGAHAAEGRRRIRRHALDNGALQLRSNRRPLPARFRNRRANQTGTETSRDWQGGSRATRPRRGDLRAGQHV